MIEDDSTPTSPEPGTTGAYLVLMEDGSADAGVRKLETDLGLSVVHASDHPTDTLSLQPGSCVVFEELGVAVVEALPGQLAEVSSMPTADSGILAIEPERIVYPLEEDRTDAHRAAIRSASSTRLSRSYLEGHRDAIVHLVDGLLEDDRSSGMTETPEEWDESDVTWGLQATKADVSRFSGRNIKVAVLDTGLDRNHPDFSGRNVVAESFVPDEDVQDEHGHGTHCAGTVCGPRQPGQLPRYGVAPDVELYVGKVLNNRGSGSDRNILAGIQWAIRHGCAVVSMSLGAAVLPGQEYSTVFEGVARRARDKGVLIVAAAGNDSYRPSVVRPVSHPANCPSIMAVGAIDQELKVATFSNGGGGQDGDNVDLAAPGVAVHSSWPAPVEYRSLNGTSMATPHVAGIAALIAEAEPAARGDQLAERLLNTARQLSEGPDAVGRGLVQAP